MIPPSVTLSWSFQTHELSGTLFISTKRYIRSHTLTLHPLTHCGSNARSNERTDAASKHHKHIICALQLKTVCEQVEVCISNICSKVRLHPCIMRRSTDYIHFSSTYARTKQETFLIWCFSGAHVRRKHENRRFFECTLHCSLIRDDWIFLMSFSTTHLQKQLSARDWLL